MKHSLVTTKTLVLFAMVVFAAATLAAPLVASMVGCADVSEVNCCDNGCFLCLCCSHAPSKMVADWGKTASNEPLHRLQRNEDRMPRDPMAREILHVPISAPLG
ncbi:MAG: hypothetical protein AAGD01_02480 [Acidobacteriota bacterium]